MEARGFSLAHVPLVKVHRIHFLMVFFYNRAAITKRGWEDGGRAFKDF